MKKERGERKDKEGGREEEWGKGQVRVGLSNFRILRRGKEKRP